MIKNDLTYKIIGCAMKVHNKMGLGFQEVIYQRCLAIELGRAGLSFVREQAQKVYYEGIEVGTRREEDLWKVSTPRAWSPKARGSPFNSASKPEVNC
jgi:hypothetical protein